MRADAGPADDVDRGIAATDHDHVAAELAGILQRTRIPTITVTPAMREDFFKFAEASKFSTSEELARLWQAEPNRNVVDLAIQTEIVNTKFGLEAGRRVQAAGDGQLVHGQLQPLDQLLAPGGNLVEDALLQRHGRR